MECVYCAVRTEYLTEVNFSPRKVKPFYRERLVEDKNCSKFIHKNSTSTSQEHSTTIVKTNQFILLIEITAACVFRHSERDVKFEGNAKLKELRKSPVTSPKLKVILLQLLKEEKLAEMQSLPYRFISFHKRCGKDVQTK